MLRKIVVTLFILFGFILQCSVYGVICYVLLFMLRGKFQFAYYFSHVILPEALYTIVVTMFLYPIILKVNEKLEAGEKRRAQKFV